MLEWQNNSCYLDSLITMFFFNKDSYFVSNILAKTRYIMDFQKVVSINSEIKNKQEYLEFHKSLTREIYNLYKIQTKDHAIPISSLEIMNLLQKAIKYLKGDDGRWKTESCALIYTKFAEIYPMLRLQYQHLNPDTNKLETIKSGTIEFHNLFQPSTQHIDWDDYNCEIIVFEINTREGCGEITETILNDRYELTSFIILDNSHYTAFIKGIDNVWLYYDDTFKNIPTFSTFNSVWTRKANMLFYSKIK